MERAVARLAIVGLLDAIDLLRTEFPSLTLEIAGRGPQLGKVGNDEPDGCVHDVDTGATARAPERARRHHVERGPHGRRRDTRASRRALERVVRKGTDAS